MGMVKLAEYRDIEGQSRAERVVLETAPMRIGYSSLTTPLELARVSPGWECAGSVARWTDGYWSVRWQDDRGSYQGRMFNLETGEAEARALFVKWTSR